MRVYKIGLFLCLLMSFETGCRGNDKRPPEAADPEPGVALTLATQRAQSIQSLTYDLSFTIPANPGEPIAAHEIIRFGIKDLTHPLVLDFTPGADHLQSVKVA